MGNRGRNNKFSNYNNNNSRNRNTQSNNNTNQDRTPGSLTLKFDKVKPVGADEVVFNNPPYNFIKQIKDSNKTFEKVNKLKEQILFIESETRKQFVVPGNKVFVLSKEKKLALSQNLIDQEITTKKQMLKLFANIHHPYNLAAMALGNIYTDYYQQNNLVIEKKKIIISGETLKTVTEYEQLLEFIENIDNIQRVMTLFNS